MKRQCIHHTMIKWRALLSGRTMKSWHRCTHPAPGRTHTPAADASLSSVLIVNSELSDLHPPDGQTQLCCTTSISFKNMQQPQENQQTPFMVVVIMWWLFHSAQQCAQHLEHSHTAGAPPTQTTATYNGTRAWQLSRFGL